MRSPSPRIRRNTVRLQSVEFIPDGDGGRQSVPVGTPGLPVRCRVQPRSAVDLPAHMREEGHAYYAIHFFGRVPPPLKIRDLIHWDDFDPPQVLSVSGPPTPSAGEMATWIVPADYVVPPSDSPGAA